MSNYYYNKHLNFLIQIQIILMEIAHIYDRCDPSIYMYI